MKNSVANRFEGFFAEEKYTLLKNYLYNYLLRKTAVENNLKHDKPELILEVGSGISPVMTKTHHIIYTDLSFTAIQILRHAHFYQKDIRPIRKSDHVCCGYLFFHDTKTQAAKA